jgi:UDP:flavonoid glycosyltransferase YjiC (YdhE family)
MRITFVSMVPEAGHIIPLLRIASSIRSEQVTCSMIVPSEANKLASEHGFEYELLPLFFRKMLSLCLAKYHVHLQ